MVRRPPSRVGAVDKPVTYVHIEAVLSLDDLFDPFGKVGMGQNHYIESLQKLLMGERMEAREQALLSPGMIHFITLVTHP